MKKKLLTFEKVSLMIGEERLLAPFSFTLHEGEAIGLVGPSGAGKSQLLQAIVGLSKARVEGKILYKDRPLHCLRKEELQAIRGKEIGLILQNPFAQFNPTRTVGAQLLESFSTKTKNREERALEAVTLLDQLHIEDPTKLLASFPHEVSGGMLQRALIAMFLLIKPSVLLSDETTTALDPVSIHHLFRVLKTSDTSHIFVTHNQKAASYFCDRVFFIKEGVLCS
ncbi:MAG: ATP-binding cassette domain-containing protein [Chlamydiota bacterium]